MKESLFNQRLQSVLHSLEDADSLRSLESASTSSLWISQGNRQLLNLSTNDYLSLYDDKEIAASFLSSYPEYATPHGSGSARLLTGNYALLNEFEKEIASAHHKQAARLFNSGYHANCGIIAALGQIEGVHFMVDRMAHASMIDGLTMGRCSFSRFRHNDLSHLADLIKKAFASTQTKYVIVVVESVYSMDGDRAPLKDLVALKEMDERILLYVDEAHAIGVYGENGYGISEETDTSTGIDFLIGTFGKAILGMGAYIAADKVVIDYLTNSARSLIFSTMLPEAVMAWNRFIFHQLPFMKDRRQTLWETGQRLRNALEKAGYEGLGSSQIIPITLGSNERALQAAYALMERGYSVRAIRYPTVAKGTERLRLSLASAITYEQLSPLVDYFSK